MSKVVEFRVRGDDPSLAKMKAMLEGIAGQANDQSLKIGEVRVLAVTTEREDVFDILTRLARLHQVAPVVKKYNKKPRAADVAEAEEA